MDPSEMPSPDDGEDLSVSLVGVLFRLAPRLVELIDLGDLIGVDGHLKVSNTGEKTIGVSHVTMLTKSLARELGPEIRVNGIAPGPVLWPEGEMEEDLKREIIDKTALKRHGTPQDIARTALFLARDAPYITGQIIAVDGGRSI